MSTESGILWLWGIEKVNPFFKESLTRADLTYKCVPHVEGNIPNFKFDKDRDVVLALGGAPIQELKNFKILKKNVAIGTSRERIYTLPSGARCLTSYSPSIRNTDYNLFVELECDVQLAARLLKTGSLAPPPLDFKWVPDLTEILEAIAKYHNKWGSKIMDVSIDLETTGLVAFDPNTWIITFQISLDEKSSRVVKFAQDFQPLKPDPTIDQGTPQCREELLWVQINQILNNPRISLKGANLKFDLGWIYEKWKIECTNFKFDTLLVGSLLDENRCVDPETNILTADLNWLKAKDVKVGMELFGFDEFSKYEKGQRSLQVSTVTEVDSIIKPRIRLTLDNGTSVIVSTNHQFLSAKSSNHYLSWRSAKDLKIGQRIKLVTPAPTEYAISEFDRGRLSGFLDGEGSCHKCNQTNKYNNSRNSWVLNWGQNPWIVNEDIKRICLELGAGIREQDDRWNNSKAVSFRGAWEALKVLIASRPIRLIAKRSWVGAAIPREPNMAKVQSLEFLDAGEVVAITTTTHTFVAEGLASHNSNSLKAHACIYSPYGNYERELYQKYDIARVNEVPDDILLPYCGYDTAVCLLVARLMKEELVKPENRKLLAFYVKILHPAARAYEKVERVGVKVDLDYYKAFELELQSKLEEAQKQANEIIPKTIHAKFEAHKNINNLSLSKAIVSAEYMFGTRGLKLKPIMFTPKSTEEKPKPSTAIEHFLKFKDDPLAAPYISVLAKYKDCAKTLTTYITGFLKHLRYDDRFHASFFLFKGRDDGKAKESGTNTGRISIKDPALQCLVGDSMVLTDKGEVPIKVMVEQYEKGKKYQVLTHTGKWQDVIGVYRNGVQPVFKVTTSEGYSVTCTENHPILTDKGFIRTDALKIGYNVFTHCLTGNKNGEIHRLHRESIREIDCATQGQNSKERKVGLSMQLREFENCSCGESTFREYDNLRVYVGGEEDNSRASFSQRGESNQNVQCMVLYEDKVQQSKSKVLQGLRWSWDNLLSGVGGFQQLSEGYGGMPTAIRIRTQECGWALHSRELLLGNYKGTAIQQKEFQINDLQGGDSLFGRMGVPLWGFSSWTGEEGLDVGTSNRITQRSEAEESLSAGFVTDKIVSIEALGHEETYDLTVNHCHSFIANGMVVHNTIPKKTKWAKPLRRAFIAPEGYVLFSCFPANAPILTTKGVKKIVDIKVGDMVLVDGNPHAVSFSGCTGKDREVYRVRTRSGRYLEATGDHKIWVLRSGKFEYVELLSLTHDDYLIQEDSQEYEGMDLITPDLAYLGGLFMGDGYYSISSGGKNYPDNLKHALHFSLGKDVEDLKPELQKFADTWGCKVCIRPNGDTSLNTKKGCLFFNTLFAKNGSSDTNIPDSILLGTRIIRENFLAGAFDSDGSAHSGRLTISSINERYIQQLALLSASLGIFGVIRKIDRPTNFSPRSICYHLDIFNRDSIAKFPYGKIKRKVDRIKEIQLKAYTQCRTESIPVEALTEYNIKGAQNTVLSNRVFSNGRRNGYTTRDALKKAIESNPILDPAKTVLDYRYDKFEVIEYVGKEDVYDITVDTVHCFNAYGFRVHNCDFSQGELRIAADLAQEEAMIDAYNKNIDLHAFTGAGLAGIPFDVFMSYKDHDDPVKAKIYESNRQSAKAANFGLAISKNNCCITQLGSVKIQDIQPHHKLWDGVEWVSHGGVITQGEFYVVYWDGLWATPDHKVWIETGEKIELKDAIKRKAKLKRTATVFGKPIFWDVNSSGGGKGRGLLQSCTDALHFLRGDTLCTGKGFISGYKSRENLCGQVEVWGQSLCTTTRDTLRFYGTALRQGYSQTITRLQGKGYSMSLYFQRALYKMGFGKMAEYGFQGVGIRQDKQQWALFSRQSTVGNQCGKPSQYGVQRVSNVSGGEAILDGLEKPLFPKEDSGVCRKGYDRREDNRTCQGVYTEEVQELAGATTKVRGIGLLGTLWNYCTSIYVAGETYVRERLDKPILKGFNSEFSVPRDVGGADSGESQRRNKEEAEELQKFGIPIKRTRVYDILNAGPRRRFTCEGKLVSNCYGMGAEGYRDYAESDYGLKMTLKQATEARDKFFKTYPRLLPWHDEVKAKAKKFGYMDSPLGRRRHLPLINSPDGQARSLELRRAVNAPVQSTLSDFSLWSTAIAEKEGLTKEAPVVLMIHDQLVAYLPKDNWQPYAKRYKEIMENLPFHEFGWEPRVKFACDVEIGFGDPAKGIPPNLAQLTKPHKVDPNWDK